MRVLQINVCCGCYSTGRIASDIAKDYDAKGVENVVAYGRSLVDTGIHTYKIGTDFDIKLHGVLSRLFDIHGLGSRRATKEFLRWAEAFHPDLLWLHNIHGYYINYEMLFAWIKKHPEMQVKWTLHDCWAFTGHCTNFTYVNCDKWKRHCTACPQRGKYPASILIDNSKNNFDRKKASFTGVSNMTLITPSKWLAGLVKESFLNNYPVEVHYNTIDTNVFKPTQSDFREKYGLEEKIIVLGVASIWDERKGLNDFINLSQMLDERFVIVLVGLTEKQQRLMPKQIICIQRTNSPKELAEIYSAADLFVNPTYEDNYPTVNLEAIACGIPVISYETGGSIESAQYVVPCGDVRALADQVLKVLPPKDEKLIYK